MNKPLIAALCGVVFSAVLGGSVRAFGAAPATDPAVEQQLQKAQHEYVEENYQLAIDLAQPMIAQSKERSYRIIGAAACSLHDGALVDRAYDSVAAPAQQYLIYVCHRQYMDRINGHFKFQG